MIKSSLYLHNPVRSEGSVAAVLKLLGSALQDSGLLEGHLKMRRSFLPVTFEWSSINYLLRCSGLVLMDSRTEFG